MIRAADQRASDAEREEVVELLRIAAGEGRIGHDELDERLSRALSAKTYRQLHATVDDIPRDRGRNGRRLPQAQRSVAGWAVKAVRNEPWLLVLMLPVLVITLTLAAIGMMVWFVFLIAVLALGRSHHGPTHHLGRRRHPGQMARGPGTHGGIAGSGWRWI
jgi:Domain of unknown function (DUF1707)